MSSVLLLLCTAAAGYQLTAILAVLRQLLRGESKRGPYNPRVSILKPVYRRDALFDEAVASHFTLDYEAGYEILFGAGTLGDPAARAVAAIPEARLYLSSLPAANRKVGNLMELARYASGQVWVVNDGDIRVTAEYLNRIVPPLADQRVGLVTCLYRPIPIGMPAAWEALGIATDFAPSTLVAPLVGINEFGFGSTLCFRAEDLRKAGGFEAVAEYLADDYQLASRLTKGLGKVAVLSKYIVDTGLGYPSWQAMWRHQVRWARTIRHTRFEYIGLPITHAGLWALLAALSGYTQAAAVLVTLRMLMGFLSGVVLLRTRAAWALPLIPLWDLFAFAVWIAGFAGNTVEWGGRRMRVDRDGRVTELG